MDVARAVAEVLTDEEMRQLESIGRKLAGARAPAQKTVSTSEEAVL
nr:hypothetical protein GCM10025732_38900 [Glycomyces mayteni]